MSHLFGTIINGIDVDPFKMALALEICGWDNIMLMDPRSLEQQMIRSTSINNMESSGFLYGLNSQVDVDEVESEGGVASET